MAMNAIVSGGSNARLVQEVLQMKYHDAKYTVENSLFGLVILAFMLWVAYEVVVFLFKILPFISILGIGYLSVVILFVGSCDKALLGELFTKPHGVQGFNKPVQAPHVIDFYERKLRENTWIILIAQAFLVGSVIMVVGVLDMFPAQNYPVLRGWSLAIVAVSVITSVNTALDFYRLDSIAKDIYNKTFTKSLRYMLTQMMLVANFCYAIVFSLALFGVVA